MLPQVIITLVVALLFAGVAIGYFIDSQGMKNIFKVVRYIFGSVFVFIGINRIGRGLSSITDFRRPYWTIGLGISLAVTLFGLLLIRRVSRPVKIILLSITLLVTALSSIPIDSFSHGRQGPPQPITSNAPPASICSGPNICCPEIAQLDFYKRFSLLLGNGREEMRKAREDFRLHGSCDVMTYRLYIL